ncbi:hypothetical protein HPB48_017460 [Haemaphysalis longicornis]|uniref:Ionotropic receptor n=1 Tax=Haemaphysalis longicornis TaxID=44386 RepID=A0A9J6FYL6_HAELO|nr:hypothetical protein HPB48_017460 [Haemaphysalis longicornis]
MTAAPGINLALVSFKKHWDQVDNIWTRRMPQPVTTWTFQRGGLWNFIYENNVIERQTMAIVPSLEIKPHQFVKAVQEKRIFHNFVQWVIINSTAVCSAQPKECIRALGTCFTEKDFGSQGHEHTPSTSVLPRQDSGPHFDKSDVIKSKRSARSSREITVACLLPAYYKDFDFCNMPRFKDLLALLKMKNVSIQYKYYSNFALIYEDLYCQVTDVLMSNMGLNTKTVAAFTYSDVNFSYDTFYVRRKKGRIMHVSDIVAKCSWVLAAVTIVLVSNIGVLLLSGSKMSLKEVITLLTFLWASLLGTPMPIPRYESRRRGLNVSHVFWILGAMPLSIWFCGELTSSLAMNIPPDSLDTLEELEAALDKGSVAPCVAEEAATSRVLTDEAEHDNPLAGKLRAAFRMRKEALLVKDQKSCLLCATKTDRVCFSSRISPQKVAMVSPDLMEFRERYMLRLAIMAVRKRFPLRDAFRDFLLRLQEGDLQCKVKGSCMVAQFGEESIPEVPALGLERFFAMYALFLSGSACVLLLNLCWILYPSVPFGFVLRMFAQARRVPVWIICGLHRPNTIKTSRNTCLVAGIHEALNLNQFHLL